VFGTNYRLMLLGAAGLLLATVLVLPFRWIERVFGLCGLMLLVYAVAAVAQGPDWGQAAAGLLPRLPEPGMPGLAVYAYFVVGLFSSILMPYEIYFYSSGGIEEGWTETQLPVNRANALIGFPLGGLVAAALTVVAAQQLLALQVTPQHLGTVLLEALRELGPIGFYAAVIGAFCAIGGATIDSAFSCAYNLAQHQRWPWGKKNGIRQAKRWTAALLGAFGIGYAIVQTRVNPVDLTEYAVIASAVAMPLTFWPIVRVSQDRQMMGPLVSGPLARPLAWLFFGVICVVAIAGPVLMLTTHLGELK
jgi:Mn2+/Fe2+ NRAMP family transporter